MCLSTYFVQAPACKVPEDGRTRGWGWPTGVHLGRKEEPCEWQWGTDWSKYRMSAEGRDVL